MKKCVAAIICTVFALVFCGCSADTLSGKNVNGSGVLSENAGGYYFESKTQKIYIDEEASPVIEKLGTPQGGTYEALSCAFEGKEVFYYYDGFTIQTYEKNGKEYIYTINLEDDTVKTTEGIRLGDSLGTMAGKYGTGYTLTGDTYVYTKDKMTLTFIIENDKVAAIRYSLITD